MRNKLWGLLLIVGIMLLQTSTASAQELIVSGCSVSNVGYLNDLARQYQRKTGVNILVRGGGSLLGLTELRGDKIDFAASCRSKSSNEPDSFQFVPVAWDALVFIVNKSNPISNINLTQVRQIYEGRLTNWKAINGPDLPVKSFATTPEGMGGIGEALTRYVLDGKPMPSSETLVVMASSVAVWEQMVEKNPEGFASTGFASARKRNVKMLTVDGVEPTKQNIISGKYPFKRYLYLVYDKADVKPEVTNFINYALSKEGQKYISSLGIPSLSEIK